MPARSGGSKAKSRAAGSSNSGKKQPEPNGATRFDRFPAKQFHGQCSVFMESYDEESDAESEVDTLILKQHREFR
ncbi:hypothetical protein PI125_g25820 [Phytophthora idaei]|nr:hypothetical protein PI125_g25820 [Phytophthora idaei]KAG3124199.1 hypothetical protein PI126_g23357 [Phytophthora idaei]